MNKLQILNKVSRDAMKKALGDVTGPLAENWTSLGVTLDDRYQHHLNEEFRNLERACLLVPRLDTLLDKYNIAKKQDKLEGNWFWITLRPSPEHEKRFKEFKLLTESKYLSRAMFLETTYCWEQKGESLDELGKGYHIHILTKTRPGLMKTQLIKDTKSTFNRFLNGDVPEAFIEVEYVRTQEYFNNLLAYMKGFKKDDFKQQACELDPVWRQQERLDSIYGFACGDEGNSSKSEAIA